MAVEFYRQLREAYNSGKSFVLCTIIDTKGSSPGKVGQKMIVFRDGSTTGTIGGGINEERARAKAMDMFAEGGSKLVDFDMTSKDIDGLDPICGGEFKLLMEYQASEPSLCIFGAGHIGKRLAEMACLAGFNVTITDERPEYADAKLFSKGINVICDPYEEAAKKAKITPDSFVVVCTPGHSKDRETIEAVLPYKPQYLGLVGSAKKRSEFMASLKAKGFDPAQCEAIFTPIGISLGSTTPEEIVVEILAQIVAFRNGHEIRYSRL